MARKQMVVDNEEATVDFDQRSRCCCYCCNNYNLALDEQEQPAAAVAAIDFAVVEAEQIGNPNHGHHYHQNLSDIQTF